MHQIEICWIKTKPLPENITKFLKKIYEHSLSIHPGINRMHEQLKTNGNQWPGMRKNITEMTKTNRRPNKIPMVITDTATEPFQKI